ncbi:MAG: beta-propeller fold lactonase family protein, partial [Chloroflexi bacterium]|nr:beta-propeller fold lactonase family protein [Chloroflexota bacterium]
KRDISGAEQSLATIPSNAPENIVADIHISATGKRLYVSNRGDNSVAIYDISDDGSLKLVAILACGGNWPRNFALTPGEKFILMANQYSNEICVLPILIGSEALGAPLGRVPVEGAACLQIV